MRGADCQIGFNPLYVSPPNGTHEWGEHAAALLGRLRGNNGILRRYIGQINPIARSTEKTVSDFKKILCV